ncbi:GNAT family N-acetyltransferase [Blastococcus saxobsidens]|uniref:N-acetyltransferase domain-containing protein n=1 Tax=Blastococcus saxobsidens (strain DD2) TaxID=1146883 RepID=H6RMX8_BLASD|nr:GNAT family N-acetyltransferase [Blastococcus saxobsidens]CCG01331.1 conserved protein of unknown function [Blastococcus saxobsidens DD2]
MSKAADRPSYDVVLVEDVPRQQIVELLQAAFGPAKTADHYTWKHVEGPWGPSRGWVAVDGDAVLGARLIVPWRLALDGRSFAASRAMDGAVTPAARGRGVFSGLVRREMSHLAAAERWHVLYSTSVPASREAYRRLGWTILEPRPSVLSVRLPRRPALVEEIDPRTVQPTIPAGRLHTDWDARGLGWRVDPRSGHRYEAVQLRNGGSRLLYRRTTLRGVPVLVVVVRTGPPEEQSALLGAACARGRCGAVILQALDPATSARPRVVSGSTVSVWQQEGPDAPVDARAGGNWTFTGADLEGVL